MSHTAATLLVVDDDAMNRDALSRRLARTGYTVLTAGSGPDALAVIVTAFPPGTASVAPAEEPERLGVQHA